MKKKEKMKIEKFKIAVLEDNLFYNRLLKRHMEDYFENLGVLTNCVFSIKSYTNTNDFVENLSENTDVALIDFYLQEGETALRVMEKVKEKSQNCKIIIISGVKNIQTYYKTFWMGAVDFIKKDPSAPLRSCRIIESIFSEKIANVS